MTDFLGGQKRTIKCGLLTKQNVGEQVTLMGWVHRRRNLGSIIFLQIRDTSGICQVVFDPDLTEEATLNYASSIKLEYVVAITGTVRMRTEGNANSAMATGEIEVVAHQLKILSVAQTTPFSIGDESANELLRLQYRYLDLRRSNLQQNLILRSNICKIARNYFSEQGFTEIETPMMGRSTPEGARDYLVPSRVHEGEFYALPQSPQLYKQLLMIGGMDKYYQIARCFRDEDLRANRQPEFTQIDMEMSFIDKEADLMAVIEGLVKRMFKQILNVNLKKLPQMTYANAMARYGSDKPDLRFGMEINDITKTTAKSGFVVFENAQNGFVGAVVLHEKEAELSRKELDKLTELVKTYKAKGLAWLGINADGSYRCTFTKVIKPAKLEAIIKKLQLQKGDIALIVADGDVEVAQTALGALRCNLAERFDMIRKGDFKALWIVDFPLLEYKEEEQRWGAKHHPFTAPKDEDLYLLDTCPQKARAKAYDLVINGDEIGGGSMRIYNNELQQKMFNILGFNEQQIKDKFGFFVNAFNYGTPPHGGFAFGLDRLVMTLGEITSIRDVIAFPKTQSATCMMSDAPAPVEQKQLNELAISITEPKQ